MHAKRLNTGGRIDRSQPLTFRFNGKRMQALPATRWRRRCWPMACRLSAAASSCIARAASSAAEPRSRMRSCKSVRVHNDPNLRATQVELYDGLVARSDKGWPSVSFDLGAINDRLQPRVCGRFLLQDVHAAESAVAHLRAVHSRVGGLWQAPTRADPDTYEHRNAHCDVLVAGGGPAGLMAALAAARSGARVILADEQNEFGGSCWRR